MPNSESLGIWGVMPNSGHKGICPKNPYAGKNNMTVWRAKKRYGCQWGLYHPVFAYSCNKLYDSTLFSQKTEIEISDSFFQNGY